MEDSSLQHPGGTPAPQVFRPGPGPWRILLGVLVSIATLGVTLILGFLSLCFGLLLSSSPSAVSSDRAFIYGIFAATVLVPIGGTWLAVYLFRGPKRSRAAVAGMSAAAPLPVPSVPAKELEERVFHLRIVVLVAILGHAAELILGFETYRGGVYRGWLVPALVSFVLYQVPYAVVLAGIATRPRRWAVSLALMFPILSLCFTAFSYVWIFSRPHMGGLIFARNPLVYTLGPILTVAVIIFAWRAWQVGPRSSDDAVQLVVCGVVSTIYLFTLQSLTPFLYRWVH